MTIYIGADYRGENLKKEIISYLESCGNQVIDLLKDKKVNDYTEVAFLVGEHVRDEEGTLGILICGSGSGVCIAANKVKGIRCVRAASVQDAFLGRDHDGANILALGSEITPDISLVKDILDTFFNTPMPTLERRLKRFEQIKEYEDKN